LQQQLYCSWILLATSSAPVYPQKARLRLCTTIIGEIFIQHGGGALLHHDDRQLFKLPLQDTGQGAAATAAAAVATIARCILTLMLVCTAVATSLLLLLLLLLLHKHRHNMVPAVAVMACWPAGLHTDCTACLPACLPASGVAAARHTVLVSTVRHITLCQHCRVTCVVGLATAAL
jgi:hypothetical protein